MGIKCGFVAGYLTSVSVLCGGKSVAITNGVEVMYDRAARESGELSCLSGYRGGDLNVAVRIWGSLSEWIQLAQGLIQLALDDEIFTRLSLYLRDLDMKT